MIQVNPGNLLKFNLQPIWQRHKQPGQDRHPFGLKCPAVQLLPFQLFISDGASSVTWKLVNPSDDTGATFTAMTAGDLEITQKDGGGAWVTWPGNSSLTTVPACGFWEVWVTVDGIVYYSEVVHTYDGNEPSPVYYFVFTHNTDKGGVLYQEGYQQIYYPTKWAWDRPEVDREIVESVDGNGNVTIRFSRTTARFRIEVADVPDFAIPFLAKCGDFDNVILANDTTGAPYVEMANIVFESKVQGVGLNIGILKFDAEVEAFNGCQENFVLA